MKNIIKNNQQGDERTIGIELEYTDLSLAKSAELIQSLYGGDIQKDTEAFYQVLDTELGDFNVELDAVIIQKIVGAEIITKKNGSVIDEVSSQFSRAVTELGEKIVPIEIAAPPVKLSEVPKLEQLVIALRDRGAKDTRESIYNAFGLHLNSEIASTETDYLVRHLQSFLLLFHWLVEKHGVDLSRKLSSFIEPFPKEYLGHVLTETYQPDFKTLVTDYHRYNPTRNRPLDMLPVFAHFDKDYVVALYGKDEKINPRPTFHYRLPNCEFNNPSWSLEQQLNYWFVVELVASDETLLRELMSAWQHWQNQIFSFRKNWIKTIEARLSNIL